MVRAVRCHTPRHFDGTSALARCFCAEPAAGGEILVPSYTFFATITPMRFFGLGRYSWTSIRTLNFDLEDAKRTPNTKAVLPVH